MAWHLIGGTHEGFPVDGSVSNLASSAEADVLLRCPLTNNCAVLEVACGEAVYKPNVRFVEPNHVKSDYVDYRFGSSRDPDQAGAIALRLSLYVYPKTVNFEEIALEEVPWLQGGYARGYYADPARARGRYHDGGHGAGRWHNVTTNNFWAIDMAGSHAITNWAPGELVWDIPLGWNARDRLNGTNAVKIVETVQMKFSIDSNGTVRVEKFDNWASRGLSTNPIGPDDGPVLLNGEKMNPLRDMPNWAEQDRGLLWL